MSTIACPGCGMPRAAELFDEKPCPICNTLLPPAHELEPELVVRPQREPASPPLPADASELASYPMPPGPFRGIAFGLIIGFGLGTIAGIAGLYAWQHDFRFDSDDAPELASAEYPKPPIPRADGPTRSTAPPAPLEKSPATSTLALPSPESQGVPQPMGEPPPAGKATVIEVNLPEDDYSLPFPTRMGEHVILKGQVKSLKLAAIEGHSIVDASGLLAREIFVEHVDGGSTVKLSAPEGRVTFGGKVDGRSVVVIHAPGGQVRFPTPTAAGQEGSTIRGGSRVNITAKRVDLRGDITGQATQVNVILTRAGALRAAAVQDSAVLEYRMENSGWSVSDVTVGPIAPSATVRDAGPTDAADQE